MERKFRVHFETSQINDKGQYCNKFDKFDVEAENITIAIAKAEIEFKKKYPGIKPEQYGCTMAECLDTFWFENTKEALKKVVYNG